MPNNPWNDCPGISITLNSSGATLNAEGELSINAEGVLDGAITLRVAGPEALPAFIAGLPPQLQKLGNVFVGALFAFGRPTTIDGEPASELTVPIEDGVVSVGVFSQRHF